MRIAYEENTSPDIREAAEQNAIVIVPLACTEQHGPHLPLNSDYGRPIRAAQLAQERHGAKVLVLPLLPFGPAAEHTGFPGTISLSFATWSTLVVEILANLVRDGFRRIVITKGCGGHMGIEGPVYEFFCQKRRSVNLDIRLFGEQAWREIGKLASESEIAHPDEVHAGGVETSMVLAKTPDLVRLDRLRKPERKSTPYHWCWWVAEELSDTGATGDPTKHDVELGRKICNRMDEILSDFLGEMWKAQPSGRGEAEDRAPEPQR